MEEVEKTDHESKLPAIIAGPHGIELRELSELWRFSKLVIASGLAPKGFDKPEMVMIAIEMGMEIGLPPLAALQNIAVINGRPAVWGDGLPALVHGSGKCDFIHEFFEGEGAQRRAICVSKRKGARDERRTEFSVEDAKKAGLWGKTGPWTQYPDRMLQMRARGFNLRDNFADVLKGVRTVEEAQDTDIEAEIVSVSSANGETRLEPEPEPAQSKTEALKEKLGIPPKDEQQTLAI